MTKPLPRHPFGFRYVVLLLGAWLIRLPSYLAFWINEKRGPTLLRPSIARTRIRIPSRDSGRSIAVDVYEQGGQSKRTKRYAHVNFHGSGFIIPSLGTDTEFCDQLASTGTVVFDADYRKAPEHPFPAAFQDAEDVLAYIQDHEANFDNRCITVSGFSAGANLAMALAVNSKPGAVAGVVSIYGNTDMTRVYPAPGGKNYDSGAVLPEWLRRFFYNCLILPGQDRGDPRLSPGLTSPDRWPKHVFLACGTADSLHRSGEVLVEKLKGVGHEDVGFLSVEREAHAFDKAVRRGTPTAKRRDEVYRESLNMISRAQKSL